MASGAPAQGWWRDEARLLGCALEDRLLREPDSQHLTVIARDADDDGVVARYRCRATASGPCLPSSRQSAARPPPSMREIETAPASEGNWCLSSRDSMLLLRCAQVPGEVIDGPLHEAR